MPNLTRMWRRLQRFFSRAEWMRRLFFLGYEEDTSEGEGLILIQIDGLARGQFERALAHRRMPFLRRLLKRHGYTLHSHYSGMPSSTPAVQAEIMYAYRCAVPAWDFYRNDTGAYRSMFELVASNEVEDMLKEHAPGLLEGGSAYCDIYGGCAKSPNFCASHLGWNDVNRVNPLGILLGVILHAWVAVRLVARTLLEIVISVRDLFYGVKPGEFWEEVKFIPLRTFTSIMLRDVMTLGAKMDAARGIPVIHLNYLGYDEQSHRRGPGSYYAHWTLKGIDYAIGRLYRMAAINSKRRYQVWIYSDHGQEKVVPYHRHAGKPIAEAVTDVLKEQGVDLEQLRAAEMRHRDTRGSWLRKGRQRQQVQEKQTEEAVEDAKKEPKITNKGPVSNVYLFVSLENDLRDRIAQALVRDAKIPMVLVRHDDAALIFTKDGMYKLPEDGPQVLGEGHPFHKQVAEDLVRLAHHPHAGNFVLLGLQQDGPYITYAHENGSHAGPGPNETHGFILLPPGADVPELEKGYLRPEDLYHAGTRALKDFREPVHVPQPAEPAATPV